MVSVLPEFDTFGTAGADPRTEPEKANAAVAAVLKDTDKRGAPPVIDLPEDTHVRLERGILRDGVWHRDAEVRELTGEDEEALARVGASWYRVIDTLIQRGVRTVGPEFMSPKLAGELLVGDREALVLAIRKATFGRSVDFEKLPCPSCGEATDLSVSLDDLPVSHLDDPHQTEFEVALRKGATAYVTLPTGDDQSAVAALKDSTPAAQNSEMLRRCVTRVVRADRDTESGSRLARSLGMADRRTILEFFAAAQPGPRFDEVTWVHDACGEEVPLPLTLAILFRGM